MTNPRPLGLLCGLPVEVVQSMNHPDIPEGGMSCGTARTWIRWGGGPWQVQEGGPGFRSTFQIADWLAAGPWTVADAVELWGRWGYAEMTEADAAENARESEAALVDWDGARWRYLERQHAAAVGYARGLGLEPP